jgi:hypothetical protein
VSLLISVSWVDSIIGMRHHAQLRNTFFVESFHALGLNLFGCTYFISYTHTIGYLKYPKPTVFLLHYADIYIYIHIYILLLFFHT